MMTTLYVLHWVSALIIVIESVDKLHQCQGRFVDAKGCPALVLVILKGIAWIVMASASAGVLVSPFFRVNGQQVAYSVFVNPLPSLGECGVYLGFAVLVVRSWIKGLIAEINRAKMHQARETALIAEHQA